MILEQMDATNCGLETKKLLKIMETAKDHEQNGSVHTYLRTYLEDRRTAEKAGNGVYRNDDDDENNAENNARRKKYTEEAQIKEWKLVREWKLVFFKVLNEDLMERTAPQRAQFEKEALRETNKEIERRRQKTRVKYTKRIVEKDPVAVPGGGLGSRSGISGYTIIVGQGVDFNKIMSRGGKKDARMFELYKIDFHNAQLPAAEAPLERFRAVHSNATSISDLNEPGTLVTHSWKKDPIQEYLFDFIDDKKEEASTKNGIVVEVICGCGKQKVAEWIDEVIKYQQTAGYCRKKSTQKNA
jgi:hypothetical protein